MVKNTNFLANDNMDKESAKFEFLYHLIKAEYQSEIERIQKIDERAMRLFAVLSVIFPLLANIVLRYEFWKSLKELDSWIFAFLIGLMISIFLALMSAWYELFKNLRNKKIEKIDFGYHNVFEDIVYDDSKNMQFLYWQTYKTCQMALMRNLEEANRYYQSLEIAQDWIKRAFTLFCVFLFTLFLCYLYRMIDQ